MDEQDKEFERFLQQFHLRPQAAFRAEVPVEAERRWHGSRLVLAAAAAVVVAILSIPFMRHSSSPVFPGAIIEVSGDSLYKTDEMIAAGDAIRSGGFEPLLLRLQDGTRVEMRAQSQIVLESAEDGSRVLLNSGSILVRAAKQRERHLYVKTKDTTVSVVGTLFLVESLLQGSRVAVIEGEVEVLLGTETRKLVMGEQVSSSSEIEPVSIDELIAWSREVGSLRTLVVGGLGAVRESKEKTRTTEAVVQPLPATPRPASARGQTPQQQPEPPQQQAPQEQPQPAPSPERQRQPDAGADGPGRQAFYRACVACHNDEIAKGRQWPSREAIENFVKFEISRGASVSAPEVQPLVDYIYTNYRATKQ